VGEDIQKAKREGERALKKYLSSNLTAWAFHSVALT